MASLKRVSSEEESKNPGGTFNDPYRVFGKWESDEKREGIGRGRR